MPTYEYRCSKCSKAFEIVQKITDDPLTACPECGEHLEKLINGANFILKGNGWYKTDYAAPGPAPTGPGGQESCSADKSKPACHGCPANSD